MDKGNAPRSMQRAMRKAEVCPVTHKQGYRNKKTAQKFAERTMQISGQKIATYCCHFCSKWHLTSHAPRERVA